MIGVPGTMNHMEDVEPLAVPAVAAAAVLFFYPVFGVRCLV